MLEIGDNVVVLNGQLQNIIGILGVVIRKQKHKIGYIYEIKSSNGNVFTLDDSDFKCNIMDNFKITN